MKLVLSESLFNEEIFHNSNGKDYDILLKNKNGDALVKDLKRDEWICAYRLSDTEWAQGHYFDNYEDAKVYWDIHYADEIEESLDGIEDYYVIDVNGFRFDAKGPREHAESVAQEYRDEGFKNVRVFGKEDLTDSNIDDALNSLKKIEKDISTEDSNLSEEEKSLIAESTRIKEDEVVVDIHEDGFIGKMHELRDMGYERAWAGDGKIGFVKWADAESKPIEESKKDCEKEDPYKSIRRDWGDVNPTTKVFKDKSKYDRKDKHKKDLRYENDSINEEYEDYKGYQIEYDFYGDGEYTVQYCGDDIVFNTKEEAKAFIDGLNKALKEDIVKKSNGKWTNRGDDGKEHGEFKTKKEAAAQMRAMYARGFKGESLKESSEDDLYEYTNRFSATAHEDDSYDSPVFSIDSDNIQKIIDFAWRMIQKGYYIFAIEHPSSDIECIAPDEILNSGDAKEKLERRLKSIVHEDIN